MVENFAGGQLEVCVKIVSGTLARDIQVHITSSDGTAKGNLYMYVCGYLQECICKSVH